MMGEGAPMMGEGAPMVGEGAPPEAYSAWGMGYAGIPGMGVATGGLHLVPAVLWS